MKTQLLRSTALLALIPLFLAGCSLAENQLKMDRETNMEFQDVRDAFAPREAPMPETAKGEGIPEFSDYTATNSVNARPMPLVSVSVNETIPLKDVLYELAQQANYDLEIDPRIDGAIIFSAKNRPFDEVMSRIAELAGLRFKFDNDMVRVEVDTPYSKTYKINHVLLARTVTSNISVSNGGAQGSSSGSSSSGGSSSSFAIASTGEVDFWKDLDNALKAILKNMSADRTLTSATSPLSLGSPSAIPSEGTTSTVPTDVSASPAPAGSSSENSGSSEASASFVINKQAGLVNLYAPQRVHHVVQKYIEDLEKEVGAQVLVEARVFEVSLSDEFATGIEWSRINMTDLFGSRFTPSIGFPNPGLGTSVTDGASFSFNYSSGDIDALVDAVSRFGTVRGLASPRLTMLNNQSSLLNVVQNTTYFNISLTEEEETNPDGTPGDTNLKITSEPKTASEGVTINVTPSIDIETGYITMTVRPTVSRIRNFIDDPGFEIVAASYDLGDELSSPYPNMDIQEFDSVLKIKSGDVVVLGGLLQDRASSTQEGVPVISEVPVLGNLFKNQKDKVTKTELVVLLRATLVNSSSDSIHQTDRDMYKLFSRDRRPLPM